MKRLSFFLAGIIAGIAGLMAEQPMWSVSGTVFDFEGRTVPGAAIFAKADTVTYGMTTGSEGYDNRQRRRIRDAVRADGLGVPESDYDRLQTGGKKNKD